MSISVKTMEVDEEDPLTLLPPIICNNPREKIEPEKVDVSAIVPPHREEKFLASNTVQLVPYPGPKPAEPCPRYPLSITWSPDQLYFELNEKPIINKLLILNGCSRIIYIHCCGLWNENGRLGASWLCCPRTRFHIAPGLHNTLYIRATPRPCPSPIPGTMMCLQLAASHKRDNVTGYFSVPIVARFLNYRTPCLEEG